MACMGKRWWRRRHSSGTSYPLAGWRRSQALSEPSGSLVQRCLVSWQQNAASSCQKTAEFNFKTSKTGRPRFQVPRRHLREYTLEWFTNILQQQPAPPPPRVASARSLVLPVMRARRRVRLKEEVADFPKPSTPQGPPRTPATTRALARAVPIASQGQAPLRQRAAAPKHVVNRPRAGPRPPPPSGGI